MTRNSAYPPTQRLERYRNSQGHTWMPESIHGEHLGSIEHHNRHPSVLNEWAVAIEARLLHVDEAVEAGLLVGQVSSHARPDRAES